MLYVLTGSDIDAIKKRGAQIAKGHELLRFGEGALPFSEALSHLGARGLFAPKMALLLDRPSEDAEGKTIIGEHAEALADADMPVIVIETTLTAAEKKAFGKKAEFEEFEEKKKADMPPPSVFTLTDAFASGNRKNAWILYRKLIEGGSAPEEVHGALSWQARAMVLASKTKSASEAGLKPFVYTKAKRAVSKMTPEQTERISRELVDMLHASRMGQGNLESLIEAFLLKKA